MERTSLYLCVDLGSVNSLPKLSVGDVFYKNQLSCYALYVSNLGSKLCTIYTWNQTQAKRGAQELCSCLLKHFESFEKIDDLIIWFDNCSGQNKSQINVAFYSFLAEQNKFESVTLKFFEVGHSFNPCDSNAGVTEKKLRRFSKIETEAKMYSIMRDARTESPKFVVTEMNQKDFLAWGDWGSDRFKILQRNVADDTYNFRISCVRQMWICSAAPRNLNFLYTFLKNEPPKVFCFDPTKRTSAPSSFGKPPPSLYTGILQMKPKKARDILYLTRFLEPVNRPFYVSLCVGTEKAGDVEEVEDVEDDDFLAQMDQYGSEKYRKKLDRLSVEEERNS